MGRYQANATGVVVLNGRSQPGEPSHRRTSLAHTRADAYQCPCRYQAAYTKAEITMSHEGIPPGEDRRVRLFLFFVICCSILEDSRSSLDTVQCCCLRRTRHSIFIILLNERDLPYYQVHTIFFQVCMMQCIMTTHDVGTNNVQLRCA